MTTKITIKKDKDGKPRVNKKGLTTVYVQYQHDQKSVYFPALRVDASTLELVDKNGRLELIDPYIKRSKDSKKKTAIIKEHRKLVEDIALDFNGKNVSPTILIVKEALLQQRSQNTTKYDTTSMELEDIFQLYLDSSDSTRWSPGTIRQYRSTLSALRRFKAAKGTLPRIHEYDLQFYDELVKHLMVTEGKKKNTAGGIIKNLKAFLHWADSRGFEVHPDVNHRDFKILKERKEILYLSNDELQSMIDLDLSGNKRLDQVRDVFVFNCRTGMRYGDLRRLTKSHIKEVGGTQVIKLMQEKTNRLNYIPITSLSKSILLKYNYVLPIISEQRMNDYIKEVGQMAEINTLIESNEDLVPKYELLSTHIAIKTFITHCVEKGISPKTVSEITGKSLRVLMDHYYGTNSDQIIHEMTQAFN